MDYGLLEEMEAILRRTLDHKSSFHQSFFTCDPRRSHPLSPATVGEPDGRTPVSGSGVLFAALATLAKSHGAHNNECLGMTHRPGRRTDRTGTKGHGKEGLLRSSFGLKL